MLCAGEDAETPVARPRRKCLRFLRREEGVALADGDEARPFEGSEGFRVVGAVSKRPHRFDHFVVPAGEHELANAADGLLRRVFEQQLRALVLPEGLDASVLDAMRAVNEPLYVVVRPEHAGSAVTQHPEWFETVFEDSEIVLRRFTKQGPTNAGSRQ